MVKGDISYLKYLRRKEILNFFLMRLKEFG